MVEEGKNHVPQALKDQLDYLIQSVNAMKDDIKEVQENNRSKPVNCHLPGNTNI